MDMREALSLRGSDEARRRQQATHSGVKQEVQGAQFLRDLPQNTVDAPGNILKWARDNPVDAVFTAASMTPVVGDAIGLGYDAYGMSPWGDVPFNKTNVGLAAAGLIPFVPSGMGSIKNVLSGPPSVNPKRYPTNAEQKAVTAAEEATYNIPNRQSLVDYANETGKMIEPPWGAKGPKLSLNKMLSMEDALRIDAPPPGMYAARNVITPEDIPIGSNLTNLAGDQSGIGVLRNTLSGKSNVNMDGGFAYPQRRGDDIWNSHGGVVNQIQSIADNTPDRRTFALTSDMTPISLHFNNMVNDRFFELFDTKLITSPDVINETLSRAFKASKSPSSFDGFPGIKSPIFQEWATKLNGTNRSTLYLALDKGAMQKNGIPDLGEIKHAISSPDSRYRPSSTDPLVGYNAAEIIPGNVGVPNADLDIPHGTYPVGMKGEYPGGLDVKIPRSVAYPDWHSQVTGRGLMPAQIQGSFRQQKIIQPVTNKWQDDAMKARERVLRNK
jgi:hypothetical protein